MLAQKRSKAVSETQLQQTLIGTAENWLSGAGVRREFEQLVAAHCGRNALIALLSALDPNADSWQSLAGFRRRELSTVLKRMAQCAGDIELLNASSIAQLLFAVATDQSDITVHLLALPKLLRIYADGVKGLARVKALQPGAKPHTDLARALLTQYVIKTTGQPHDNEVARLLSVVLNRPDLTADSQKDWRRQHREILHTVVPFAANLTKH